MALNVLCVGDVVGKPGRRMLADHLGELIRQRQLDLVVVNAENAAGGSGITNEMFKKLLHYGVDVVTLGDHVYRRKEISVSLINSKQIIRPANLPADAVGKTWTVVPTKSGKAQVAVACLLGHLGMIPSDLPWAWAERLANELPAEAKIRILDFHAEATGEKIAMGWLLNGRFSIIFGTHSHVPTADGCILDGGTAYITDVGMTGPYGGVLGRKKERILHHLTTSMPTPFDVATEDPRLSGVIVSVDEESGKALAIERIELKGYKQGGLGESEPDDRGGD